MAIQQIIDYKIYVGYAPIVIRKHQPIGEVVKNNLIPNLFYSIIININVLYACSSVGSEQQPSKLRVAGSSPAKHTTFQ